MPTEFQQGEYLINLYTKTATHITTGVVVFFDRVSGNPQNVIIKAPNEFIFNNDKSTEQLAKSILLIAQGSEAVFRGATSRHRSAPSFQTS